MTAAISSSSVILGKRWQDPLSKTGASAYALSRLMKPSVHAVAIEIAQQGVHDEHLQNIEIVSATSVSWELSRSMRMMSVVVLVLRPRPWCFPPTSLKGTNCSPSPTKFAGTASSPWRNPEKHFLSRIPQSLECAEAKYSERWFVPHARECAELQHIFAGRPRLGTRIASLRSDPPYCTSLAGYIESR